MTRAARWMVSRGICLDPIESIAGVFFDADAKLRDDFTLSRGHQNAVAGFDFAGRQW